MDCKGCLDDLEFVTDSCAEMAYEINEADRVLSVRSTLKEQNRRLTQELRRTKKNG